jgi:ribosomal protein S18 acetylase RimI-like enzyme
MKDIVLQVAQRADYHKLAPWLVEMSQAPAQHCVHTWVNGSADELAQQLLGYLDDGELCYVIAMQDGRIVGAMGSEYDEELGRGWLHGPHAPDERWEEIADALLARLVAELPDNIGRLAAGLNVENARGRRFYTRHGFEEDKDLGFDFHMTPFDRVTADPRSNDEPRCGFLEPSQAPAFVQLYEATFPMAYYSGERVVRMIGDSHQVFAVAEGADVHGFAVVALDEEHASGEIQFLGVRADCRRRGYGRRLLLSAIDWLADEVGVADISLAVNERNTHALHLYESVGFKLRTVAVGLTHADVQDLRTGRGVGQTSEVSENLGGLDPTPYPDVNDVLRRLLSGAQTVLDEQFVGLYLYGSLASGDFDPQRSDVDFVVVTAGELDAETVAALEALHEHLAASGLKWAAKLEGAYLPRSTLRRHDPEGPPRPCVNEGRFYLACEESDWVIQRHLLREHPVVVAGPPLRDMIDPVGPDDLRRAAIAILHEWWAPMLDDPARLYRSDYQAYAVLTMCRALYLLEHGAVASKPVAARWAQASLDARWAALIAQAEAWQPGTPTAHVDETLAFIRYTLARANSATYRLREVAYAELTALVDECVNTQAFLPRIDDETPFILGLPEIFGGHPDFHCFALTMLDGRMAAFVVVLPPVDGAAGTLVIGPMYVGAAHRGHGLGRRLVAETVAWARARGVRRLLVETWGRNDRARRIFEALGFMCVAEELDTRVDGDSTVSYMLELDEQC